MISGDKGYGIWRFLALFEGGTNEKRNQRPGDETFPRFHFLPQQIKWVGGQAGKKEGQARRKEGQRESFIKSLTFRFQWIRNRDLRTRELGELLSGLREHEVFLDESSLKTSVV